MTAFRINPARLQLLVDSTDSTHIYRAENHDLTGVHSDLVKGPRATPTLLVRVSAATRCDPMRPCAADRTAATAKINANPASGSTQLPDVYMQSYLRSASKAL